MLSFFYYMSFHINLLAWSDPKSFSSTYDHFSARITVEEIVNHVEDLYKMPQYQNEDAENLIVEYMEYGFWDYLGLTIASPG